MKRLVKLVNYKPSKLLKWKNIHAHRLLIIGRNGDIITVVAWGGPVGAWGRSGLQEDD